MKTPQNVEDRRAFCSRLSERLRVEYKMNFDDRVRKALPKIVSSFANSSGGVLILGVGAVKLHRIHPFARAGVDGLHVLLRRPSNETKVPVFCLSPLYRFCTALARNAVLPALPAVV